MAKDNRTLLVLLGLLDHESLTGYELKQRIEVRVSHFWSASFGQIYPTLRRLEAERQVIGREEQSGKKRARRYSITERGRAVLREWLTSPCDGGDATEVLLRVFFGATAAPAHTERTLEAFAARSDERLAMLERFEVELSRIVGQSRAHLHSLLAVRLGAATLRARSRWAREGQALLVGREGEQP